VPVEKLNLRDAVVFSDRSRNADGTAGWQSSNRRSVLLPDDSREHLMWVHLAQVDESGSTPASVSGSLASDMAAHSRYLANVLRRLGWLYRLTEANWE
jgi:hypothetical protein